MILDFSINLKKKNNIKNRKLNCSLHIKKTNNNNKLMQISYYFVFTKIQKLQNLKIYIYIYIFFFSVPTGNA